MITEGERYILFDDLIDLVKEVYYNEDDYQNHIIECEAMSFYKLEFPVSRKILNGVEKSLLRSQNMNPEKKKVLLHKIGELSIMIDKRIKEINPMN